MADKKVEILRLTGNTITLYIENYRRSLINAIRRTILSDVPTMAIDFVYFYDNRTAVATEIIAHRLGLLVLKSDEALEKYRKPEECKNSNESDKTCFVEMFLDKKVPEDSEQGIYVRASDLVVSDPEVAPVYPETPIVYLAPGQSIYLVAYARLGRGREHAKWMPASVSVLRYTPVVRFDGEKASESCIECLSAYPHLVERLKKGEKGELELKDPDIKTSALRYCVEARGICDGAVKLYYDESKLLLTVESTGALRPERIIVEAINALDSRVRRVLEAVKREEW